MKTFLFIALLALIAAGCANPQPVAHKTSPQEYAQMKAEMAKESAKYHMNLTPP